MNFISSILKGICIGAGAIIPGISSGVLCVIFGIYETLLNSILNFFTDFKKNIKFLLPIGIGSIIGIFIFSNSLNYLLTEFPIHANSLFIGLILGTIPSLVHSINRKRAFRAHFVLYTIIALFIGIISVVIEKNFSSVSSSSVNFIFLFSSGFLMSIGIVVPRS